MLDPKWHTWYTRYWVEILDHWSRVGVEVAARRKSGCTKYLAAPPYILILGYGCQPNFSSSDLISPSHPTFSWAVGTHTRYLMHMVRLGSVYCASVLTQNTTCTGMGRTLWNEILDPSKIDPIFSFTPWAHQAPDTPGQSNTFEHLRYCSTFKALK